MRKVSAFIGLTLLAMATAGCNRVQHSNNKLITIGAVRAAYYLPEFVVVNQKLLEKQGYQVKLQIYQSNGDMINDFLSGRLDVAAQSSLTLFPLEERYPGNIQFVYTQDEASYSILVPKGSTIHNLTDLSGRKIVTWTSPTATAALTLIAGRLPLAKSFNVSTVSLPTLNQVLCDKNADAVFSTDVYIAQALRNNCGQIISSNPLESLITNPFFNGGGFINSKIVSQDSKEVSDIQTAFNQAIEFINNSPEQARDMLPQYIQTIENVDAQQAPLDSYHSLSVTEEKNAQEMAAVLFKAGMLTKQLDSSKLFPQGIGK